MNRSTDRAGQTAIGMHSRDDSFRTLRIRHGNVLEECKYNQDKASSDDLKQWIRGRFGIPLNRTFRLRGEDGMEVVLSPVPCPEGEILQLEIDPPQAQGQSLPLDYA